MLRARRSLGDPAEQFVDPVEASGVLFVAETSADAVLSVLERTQPGLLIVDSIQTLASDAAPSTAGSVAQVRECAQLLLGWAKSSDAPVFLAGHVTKDGSVAGPRVLEHMVDVVLAMEGEALLFAREDEVEAAWAIVDPILKKDHPLFEYEPGTWGPSQADVLLAHLGGWHEPKPPTRAR